MSEKKRNHVFLCHASEDKASVKKLYNRLKRDGVDAWLDEEELLPGQDWQLEITKAVKASEAIVVCLSSQSVTKSGFVQKEIRLALDVAKEKPEGTIYFIPARLDECPVPDSLQNYQWVNLFTNKGYEKLLKALKSRLRLAETKNIDSRHKDYALNSGVAQVTIILKRDFPSFTENDKNAFVAALAKLAGVSLHEIRVLEVVDGSVIVTIEMPQLGATRLLELYHKNNAEVQSLAISSIELRIAVGHAGDLNSLLNPLDEMVGLVEVKRFIRELISLILVKKRSSKNTPSSSTALGSMVFIGNPGTGKTTVARLLGQILAKIGYFKNGHVLMTTPADFIAEYIGHTAIKTRLMVERALDGILFIDEAYLFGSSTFGKEAISEIYTLMESYRSRMLFILSGYENQMKKFLEENPSLGRRIPYVISFPDYSEDELLAILEVMASQSGVYMLPTTKEKAKIYLSNAKATQGSYFGNTLVVRHLLEQMESKYSERILRENIDVKNQPQITPADVPEFRT